MTRLGRQRPSIESTRRRSLRDPERSDHSPDSYGMYAPALKRHRCAKVEMLVTS
jgi:hypothetical protein